MSEEVAKKAISQDIDKQEGPKEFKTIWKSKTFWINLISIVAFAVQHKYGFVIDEGLQVQILGGVNILLRTITSDGVRWS